MKQQEREWRFQQTTYLYPFPSASQLLLLLCPHTLRPPRKGFFIFKRWDLDLPQASSLAAPLPVPEGQLLLVKSSKPEGKVGPLLAGRGK
jgi:hypothetical protein